MKAIAVLGAALLIGGLAAPASAARADEPEVVSIAFAAPAIDVSTGWAVATVSVHLRHPAGLPDTMNPADSDNTSMVTAERIGNDRTTVGPRLPFIGWPRLDRVSGTASDGVWRSAVELSPGWHGDYRIIQVQVVDTDGLPYYLSVTDGPALSVTGGETWSLINVPPTLRVVTGRERWRPQARVVNTVTGRGVGGARIRPGSIFDQPALASRLITAPPGVTDAAGLWTSPATYGVDDLQEGRLYPYGARGSRGWSLQGIGCVAPVVQRQGSASYSDLSLVDDQPLVVTGNVWPAPSVASGSGIVRLERNLGAAGWQTLTAEYPRSTGRYTLTWYPTQPGAYEVRVRMPGGSGSPCAAGSRGTTLSATPVTVRWSNR